MASIQGTTGRATFSNLSIPPMSDTVQGKMQDTFHALNRSRSVAANILEVLQGPALAGSQDAAPGVSKSLQKDAEDNFHIAHEVEGLLIQIRDAIGNA